MNETTLCFDFGNTRLKCGCFLGSRLEEVIDLNDGETAAVESLLKQYQPAKTILSSVIEHDPAVEEILSRQSSFHKLSEKSKLPFSTPVGRPETIGPDRLALSAAAVHFYPGHNNLVIGLGSCITYNFINKHYQFLGGSISPGMEMRFKAMNHFTARLPLIEPESFEMTGIFPLIGYDTRTNLLTGVLLGMAVEIDGIIKEYEEKYRNFNVLLTGGNSLHFAHLLKCKIFADPDLIFKGLYAISQKNDDTKN